MSTQYKNTYYCTNCQDTSEYPNNITVEVLACASNNEIISNELYNQMLASLESIRVFGDYDTQSIRKPAVNTLSNKNNYTLIYPDYYNSIANAVYTNYTTQNTNDKIYGTYFTNLKNTVLNYKVPDTRYYKTTEECCDYCNYTCQYCTSCVICTTCEDSYQCSSCEGCYGSYCSYCSGECGENCQGYNGAGCGH